MIKFKQVTHYRTIDPEFERDYCYIEIFKDGELAIEYGDQYHDKGREKADAFFDAIAVVLDDDDYDIEYLLVADA